MSMSPMLLLKPLTLGTARAYPDIHAADMALAKGDWPTVVAFFAELPAEHDPSVAVSVLTAGRKLEPILTRAGGGPAESPLAALLLGAHLVRAGWRIRTRKRAQYVSAAQFRAFHDHLRRADALLSDVTAADPGNVAAWTERVTVARGLQLGIPEARRRYDSAAAARPQPFTAQAQLVQQLCSKWGGSAEALLSFAKECADQAPLGSLNAAIVADSHIELARETRNEARYLRQPDVVRDLVAAHERSVGHPSYRPVHGWVQARNSFAYALRLAGQFRLAGREFGALDRQVTTFPWSYLKRPKSEFSEAQLETLLKGGACG